ncbi:MAG TPA: hypothetical protein VGK47_11850 [Nitrososphaeraceae archaeon]
MPETSGLYASLTPRTQQIFDAAYQLAGKIPSEISDLDVKTAFSAGDRILEEWINKGLNLWTVKQGMLALKPNQVSYALPVGASAIMEASLRTSTRQLGGTPFSSAGGNAASAFDGNSSTACTQTSANGYISYNWGSLQYGISLVGIQSNVTTNYTLVCEYSYDNVTWTEVLSIAEQSYSQGVNEWFVVQIPTPANYFRVRETGGATLNIQELYFNTTVQDYLITPLSRAEYVALVQKQQTGRPTSFYLDRQISPTLNIWPAPTATYNNLYYTYTRHMEDIGTMTNSIQVPARFLRAFERALGHDLHCKLPIPLFNLDKANYLQALANESYQIAAAEDRERVPFRIYGQHMGWTLP